MKTGWNTALAMFRRLPLGTPVAILPDRPAYGAPAPLCRMLTLSANSGGISVQDVLTNTTEASLIEQHGLMKMLKENGFGAVVPVTAFTADMHERRIKRWEGARRGLAWIKAHR
jgi:hypothetical protein